MAQQQLPNHLTRIKKTLIYSLPSYLTQKHAIPRKKKKKETKEQKKEKQKKDGKKRRKKKRKKKKQEQNQNQSCKSNAPRVRVMYMMSCWDTLRMDRDACVETL